MDDKGLNWTVKRYESKRSCIKLNGLKGHISGRLAKVDDPPGSNWTVNRHQSVRSDEMKVEGFKK